MLELYPSSLKARRFTPGQVRQFLEQVTHQSLPSNFKSELRVSSFPYCSVLDLVNRTYAEPVEWDYHSGFYTGIGTAVHSNLQTYAPLNSKDFVPVGEWKCPKCKAHSEIMLKPKKCGRCGLKNNRKHPLEYEEIHFSHNGLSGHLDYLIYHKPSSTYLPFEFKTVGLHYIVEPHYRSYLPSEQYVIQIETYCALLQLQYGIKVRQYALVYFSRERPRNRGNDDLLLVPFLRDIPDEQIRFRINQINEAVDGRASADIALADKRLTKKSVKLVTDRKPCINRASYRNYMTAKFFGDEECPFFEDGSCFKGSFPKKLHKMLTE